MGELEAALNEQKALRDADYPNCPYVCFWFDYRFDKNASRSFASTPYGNRPSKPWPKR